MDDPPTSLIKKYFALGLQYKEILGFLSIVHGIEISERTLKRILSKSNLFRRKQYFRIEDVSQFLQEQINTSGQLHGYRWMHLKCIQNGLVVTQEIVRELLAILDPHGVESRRKKRLRRRIYFNKGPNYVWHVDSYDKLKPYGICINGCIDGYSRHIMWLKAGRSSSDPKIIAGYYLDTIKVLNGFPKTIRSDMGTENVVVERIQTALSEVFENNASSKPAFISGKSPANQRIESWWCTLRKHQSQYWMNFFQMLRDEAIFDGTFLDKALIQFCFLDIIQHELDEVTLQWNVHKIRQTKNAISPSGRPIIMFEMPNLYNTQNYLRKVPASLVEILENECVRDEYVCDEDVYKLCNIIIAENEYIKNDDPYDAVNLYVSLKNKIKLLLGL